jgi:hypothetical protein
MVSVDGRTPMTYYENLVRHVDAAMRKHPRTPVVMSTHDFKVIGTGRTSRRIAQLVKKCRAEGYVPAVCQRLDPDRTFVY